MSKSKKVKSRIYWREQGGERRAYGDFRDVGGGREALKVPGDARATTDPLIAEKLAADRLGELQQEKRDLVFSGIKRRAYLTAFASEHLTLKAESGKFSESWLEDSERMLKAAAEHFGADRDLATIQVGDVQEWLAVLKRRPNGRKGKGTLGPSALLHHLGALSNLYRRAQSLQCVPLGFNPCAALMERPKNVSREANWLEVHDAAFYLEAARLTTAQRPDRALPFAYPLIATYLLTGGRTKEILGLSVSDINFERKTITIRPNEARGLKTSQSFRTVPLWPQLEAVLREYLRSGDAPRLGGLLFPSPHGDNAMLTDFRKALDRVAERAGLKPGDVRSKAFRHTYCAARLQTTDRGAPVALYTVSRELGHGGDALVKRIYGHLGTVRHRSECVEYRVEQHATELAPRLALLKSA